MKRSPALDTAIAWLSQSVDLVLEYIFIALTLVFSHTWVAPLIILPAMIGIAVFWHIMPHGRKVRAFRTAVLERLNVLDRVMGTSTDPSDRHRAFAEGFGEVEQAMLKDGAGSEPLIHAWFEFRESIVPLEQDGVVRNTARPGTYFLSTSPSQSNLTYWSNMYVGIGLVLTFLGIVVALHTAGEGMSGGLESAQNSLTQLLTVAGAKFFASIGGVAGSLLLRGAARSNEKISHRLISQLCERLEQGLLYVPPQRLAYEQISIQKDQLLQQTKFNTDLALAIGEQFTQAIAPVTASIQSLNTSFQSVSDGLGQGAAKAIEEASGGELRVLGQTLAALSQQLEGMTGMIASSGDDAARQIRAAGADFALAASQIKDAFAQLSGQVEGMGSQLGEQAAAAASAQQAVLEGSLENARVVQASASTAVQEAVSTLANASAEAATRLQDGLGDALAQGVSSSQSVFRQALEESGASIRTSGDAISGAIQQAAIQITGVASSMEAGSAALASTANAFLTAGSESRAVATALSDAATQLNAASAPVARTAQSIGDAASRIVQILESSSEAQSAALDQMRALAAAIEATTQKSSTAWQSYQSRFEDVDKMLAKANRDYAEAVSDVLEAYRKFANDTDAQFAKAVTNFGNSLNPLSEYAGSLDEYASALKDKV